MVPSISNCGLTLCHKAPTVLKTKSLGKFIVKKSSIILPGLVALMTFGLSPSAQAGIVPECDHSGVLSRVNRTIAIAERNVVKSGDPIVEIGSIHQHKLHEHGPRYGTQRYCHATAYTSQGHKKQLYYLIESGGGFIGISYGVEACILGRDPWRIHGAHCRSLR